ncbi:LSm family protein [Mycoplasmopsis columbinasalis]|uniref:Ribosome maturation factor RimP n=1 Tax=Mycoplasmopsis columbinasalis TaxID=114880 RepID=A0A449BAT9_9BACT|nr:hypothetical protein [Mycoplasmopsis columbinasalis]VEU78323.1 Uncharacterised protein [Mycoplasmopsis columbinasalis]
MLWKKLLEDKFGSVISKVDVVFDQTLGLTLLQIVLDVHDSEQVVIWTNQINDFLETYRSEFNFEAVDVQSKGFQTVFSVEEMSAWFENTQDSETKWLFRLKQAHEKHDSYIGQILAVDTDSFTVRWNNRGQFRKTQLPKSKIQDIHTYFSLDEVPTIN